MALSQSCIEQHIKEDAITRRWICWGLLGAAGLHAALVPFLALQPIAREEEPERIELIVAAPPEPETLVKTEPELEEPPIEPDASPPPKAEESEPPETPKEPDPEDPEKPKEPQKTEEPEEPEKTEEPEEPKHTEEGEEPDAPEDPTDNSSDANEPSSGDTNGPSPETSAPVAQRLRAEGRTPTRVITAAGPGIVVPTGEPSDKDREGTGTGETGTGEDSETRTAARSQSSQGSSSGGGSRRFGCRDCVVPDYPDAALKDEIEGQPAIEFEVDDDGNVINARVAQSSGSAALDQAALDAVRQSRFTPGGQGRARTMEVDFSIEGSERNRAARRRGEQRTVEEEVSTEEPTVTSQPTAPAAESGGLESSTPPPNAPDEDGDNAPPTSPAPNDTEKLTQEAETSAETTPENSSAPDIPSNVSPSEPTAPAVSPPSAETTTPSAPQPSTPATPQPAPQPNAPAAPQPPQPAPQPAPAATSPASEPAD